MMHTNLLAVVLSLAPLSFAADCSLDQTRNGRDPSGQRIAKAIGNQAELDRICSGQWRTGDDKKLENSFNHWHVVYKVSRTDSKQDIKYCKRAFRNIIEQCVSNGNFWGGVWSSEGETYSIINSVFPDNPLGPNDDGGPKEYSSVSTKAATTPSNSPTASIATIKSSPVSSRSTVSSGPDSSKSTAASKSSISGALESTIDGNPTQSKSAFVSSKPSVSSKSSVTSTKISINGAPESRKSSINGSPTSSKSTLGGPPLSKWTTPPSWSSTPIDASGTGHISSVAQASSVGPGQYSTTTQSISGLTANSATKTNIDGHPTVLPVWYAGPGVGIIVLPTVGIPAGAIVPPPAGYPPLTIGEDGKPSAKPTHDPESRLTSQPHSSSKSQSTQRDDKDTRTTSRSGFSSRPSTTRELRTTSKSGFSSIPSTTQKPTTTSMSEFTSCSSCSTCDLGTATISVDEDTLGNLDGKIFAVIPGGKNPTGLITSPTLQSTTTVQSPPPPLQTTGSPIDAPVCAPADIDRQYVIPETLGGTNANLRDLLYRMRQVACGGTCSSAGQGIPSDATSVLNDNGQCEIRVAVTEDIEAFLYRATPATGDQQKQCWDSFDAILSKCVDGKLRKGWWNGDHQYQFYEAGVRPVNDASAKNKAKLTQALGASTVGLTCQKDCHGFVPNPQWCNDNCAPHLKGLFKPPSSPFATRRNTLSSLQAREEKTFTCDNFVIRMNFPPHPATVQQRNAMQGEPPRSAGSFREITSNGWWDYEDRHIFGGMCYRTLRGTGTRVPSREYATEHIYEKHIVKMYLNYLSYHFTDQHGGAEVGRIADCPTLNHMFNTKSPTPGSPFNNETPAQALANAVSCYGARCPSDDRLSEFFIVEKSMNSLKENVLGEMRMDGGYKLLTCDEPHWAGNEAKLATLSAVFQYMSHPRVAAVFAKVNERMRGVVHVLDRDPFYTRIRPGMLMSPTGAPFRPSSWLVTYDYFISYLLSGAQERARQYAHHCVDVIGQQIQADPQIQDGAKPGLIAGFYSNRQRGMWRDEVLSFGQGYTLMMSMLWS